MFVDIRCRTCDYKNKDYRPLENCAEKFPQRTFADLLLEIAQIDVTVVTEHQTLPKHICGDCIVKLENAYEYVLQAQQVHEQLLVYLLASKQQIENDEQEREECLLETPIDIPAQDFVNIKLEILEESAACQANNLITEKDKLTNEKELCDGNSRLVIENVHESRKQLQLECINEADEQEENEQQHDNSEEINDPITVGQSEWKEEKYSGDADISHNNRTIVDNKSDNDATNVDKKRENDEQPPVKRKRGRPRTKQLPNVIDNDEELLLQTNDEGRFVCNVCSKSFAWRTDLNRHYNTHYTTDTFKCIICGRSFLRKDKLRDHLKTHDRQAKNEKRLSFGNSEWIFGAHLFTSERFNLIQCKLCDLSFDTILALRTHLLEHKDIDTLNALQLESNLIKELFPHAEDLLQIKELICSEIQEQQFAKYFVVLNHFGYEMSLSDSDEDPVDDVPASVALGRFKKYYCQVCQLYYARKHEIFTHMREQHKYDILPYKCNVCKLGFVSERMYRQHLQAQCRNKNKKYQCLNCPGKFMWLQNLDNHQCSHSCNKTVDNGRHILSAHAGRKRIIRCCLCTEEFATLAQLRKHLNVHADGETGCNVTEAQYYKNYYPAFGVEKATDIAAQIAQSFATQQMSRFYSALDESGNELDLNNSETDDDNGDKEEDSRKKYTCELCVGGTQSFSRRKQLLLHQNSEHGAISDLLPHTCQTCQQSFVSISLLDQHVKHICGNIHKQIKCDKCPAQFVWTENYIRHLQMKHIEGNDQTNHNLANSLQCEQCDKVFIWPKDLTRHKRTHLSESEKFKCAYCERRFNRRDNMHTHIKTHHEAFAMASRKETRCNKMSKWRDINENWCKPNGCKHIQCMICLSKHSKISDLRTHLRSHQYALPLSLRTPDSMNELNELLYPTELNMTKDKLAQRIINDINAEKYERFYCITNEVGYELNLSSSETESDSDEDDKTLTLACQSGQINLKKSCSSNSIYRCELCGTSCKRKYLLYQHQRSSHDWLEAKHVCTHCQARFVCERLLKHHYATLCKNTEKRFVCRKCPIKFMWQDNLKTHMQQHTDKEANQKQRSSLAAGNNYECVQCSRSFLMLKDLTRHMVMHNSNSYNLKCHWCPRKFYRKTNLLMHIKRHGIPAESLKYAESLISFNYNAHGKKQINCKVCNLSFNRIAMLRIHLQQECAAVMRSHYSYESMLNYSIANERGFELVLDDSETEDELENCENAALGATPSAAAGIARQYTCEMCQLVFKRKYQMALHQRSVHKYEKLPLQCQKCVFKTVSMDILAYHMRTQCYNEEKELECAKCSFKYMWQENLEIHMRLQHTTTDEPNTPMTPDSKTKYTKLTGEFKCELCNCKYNRKDRLAAHIKRYHATGAKTDNPSTTISSSSSTSTTSTAVAGGGATTATTGTIEDLKKKPTIEKKFLCAFCGKAVTSSSNLIIHMRRHTGEKPFKCDFCDMAFPRSSDLQCHRRTHTGEKPHKCTVCEKAFSRSYKLQQHMRIHSGERPYKCTYCEKSFTQSNDLTLHIRRHTGERPYICGICGERFIQGTALKNHRLMRGHFEDSEPKSRSILEQF